MATVEGVLNFPMTDETHPRPRPTGEEVPASDGNEGSDVALEQSSRGILSSLLLWYLFNWFSKEKGDTGGRLGVFLPLTPSEPGALDGSGLGGRLCVTALLLAHLVRGLWI